MSETFRFWFSMDEMNIFSFYDFAPFGYISYMKFKAKSYKQSQCN